MPDEHCEEAASPHQRKQLGIIGDIDRGFGRKFEGEVVCFLPRFQVRQEGSDGLLVADQVVVDKIDVTAIAERVEGVELSQHLRCRLGARHPAVQFDDVTEFARERAAAGELHADEQDSLRI